MNTIEIDKRKYALVPDEQGEGSECDRCALADKCHESTSLMCQDHFGEEASKGRKFVDITDKVTESEVNDYYQERSKTSGERADQLAWMFVVMMTGGLISGHAFQTFSICAMLAAVYMLLSVVQAVWQTFTAWLFKKQIHDEELTPDDYPSWVGSGAWLFYWLKMCTIATAVIYFAHAILS